MKTILLPMLLMLVVAVQTTSAQTGASAKEKNSVKYLLATQSNTTEQHQSITDKMQKETEELIMSITPAPLLALTSVIREKLNSPGTKKLKKKNKSKGTETACDL